MLRRVCAAVAVCAVLLVAGCTRVEVYQEIGDARLQRVYLKENVDFSAYHAVLIDSISVWYPPGRGPDAQALQTIDALFQQAMRKALRGVYPVVDTPARDALRVHVEFIDLSAVAPDQDIPPALQRYRFDAAPGRITLVGELKDSVTDEVLARAADSGIGELWVRGEVLDRDSLEIDFRRWAIIFRDWMDEVTGMNTARGG